MKRGLSRSPRARPRAKTAGTRRPPACRPRSARRQCACFSKYSPILRYSKTLALRKLKQLLNDYYENIKCPISMRGIEKFEEASLTKPACRPRAARVQPRGQPRIEKSLF
jgi:hypothetical protein